MAYKKFPTVKQLDRELKTNKLERIYLFLGQEDGEKEKYIARIINMAIGNDEDVSYSSGRFHIENDEFHNAVEFALSQSMFSAAKVCVMLNVNSLRAKGGDSNLLHELTETLPDSNVLIMTSSENKTPSVINNKKLDNIKVFQFWKYFESDLSSYIMKKMKEEDIKIERNAVNLLIDLLGRDIKKIDEALEKLISAGEKSISSCVVEKNIQNNKDVSIFEFIDSLFKKDKNAFNQLVKLLDNGNHELVLLKLIMRQAELIEKYHNLIQKGNMSDKAISELGINQRNKNVFIECARKYSAKGIKKVFPLMYRADYRIKSSNELNNITLNPIFELITDMFVSDMSN